MVVLSVFFYPISCVLLSFDRIGDELLEAKRSLEMFLARMAENERRRALVACAAQSVSVWWETPASDDGTHILQD